MIKLLTVLLFAISIQNAVNEKVIGGFEKLNSHNECLAVFEQIKSDFLGFSPYSVKSCEKQLVNGLNFRMTLVNSDQVIKTCKLTIYKSFDGSLIEPLKYREKEHDCFTKFENAKVSTTDL